MVVLGSWGGRCVCDSLLTCALASHQVLALRLVRVDGRDGDGVLSVGVQVLQNGGGLIAIQDGLVTETEREEEEC